MSHCRRLTPLAVALLAFASATPATAQQRGFPPPPPLRDRAHLGVQTESIRPGEPQSGLRIVHVFPESAAAEMGLRVGDEIVALNDVLITTLEQFVRELRREKIGAKIRLLVTRDGKKVKVQGKIGSYLKTFRRLQDLERKELYGKPLDPLPPVKWWNPKTRAFDLERDDPLGALEGSLSIIFAFDDCRVCTPHRYLKFVQLAKLLNTTKPPIDLIGLYQSDFQEEKGLPEVLRRARAMFDTHPPSFPVGVARLPPAKPGVREKNGFIRAHGLVMLDPRGRVRYLQTLGVPAEEFMKAFQSLAEESKAAGSEAAPASGGGPGGE